MAFGIRLTISYIVVVLLCLSVVTVGTFLLVRSQRDQLARERLVETTRLVYGQVRLLSRDEPSAAEMRRTIDEQAKIHDVFIILGNAKGDIVLQGSPQVNSQEQTIELPSGSLPGGINEPTHETFAASPGGTHLYYARSIRRLFRAGKLSNLDILVVSVPRDGALVVMADLAPTLLWAGLIGLGASALAAFVISRSVFRPTRRLTEAAEAIARGDYDREIPDHVPKEFRGLANGFHQVATQAKLSNQQLRFFVADVSHQLRNPLTSIRGFARAILDGTAEDTNAVQSAAQTIEEESMRMMRQVEQLLELARMQSGQVQMLRKPFNINDLLEHCHELFAIQAKDKDLQVKVEVEPLPPVIGDIDRLEQVFVNLLDNAIKHSPVGGDVLVNGRWATTDSIQIRVVDSGPGIPPEELPRVFERFYRTDGTAGGTGLGLAIAREIVLAHGGKIEVNSRPGEGTEFIVILPTGPSNST